MTESIAKLLQDCQEFREESRRRREALKKDLLQSLAAVVKIMRFINDRPPAKLDGNP